MVNLLKTLAKGKKNRDEFEISKLFDWMLCVKINLGRVLNCNGKRNMYEDCKRGTRKKQKNSY